MTKNIINQGEPKPTPVSKRRLTQMSNENHSSTPTLSPQALEALHSQYTRTAGRQSVNALSQGEADILNMAREALGWPTITSLAYKYYPLCPNRKWWQRALERCSHHKIRTVTLNIRYLLLTIESVRTMALKAAFSGKGVLNRLVHSTNTTSLRGSNRLVPGRQNINPGRYYQGLNPLPQRSVGLEVMA